LCEKHYTRKRRGAPIDGREPAGRYSSSAGYVVLFQKSHPLAQQEGRVAEHRVVAYGANNGVCPPCFWCSVSLRWEDAVVDHLDEVKSNNDPKNLVVACNPCNRARGAILPFLARLSEHSMDVFLELARAYRNRIRESG